jgi:EAL domain-containing protein (putative c-di-GMP-specific phosphodiesterase class I)
MTHLTGDKMIHRKISNFIHFFEFIYSKKRDLYEDFNKQNGLKELIRNEKMDTFFQPIVSLCDEKTIGFEILNKPAFSEQFPTTESFYDYVGKSQDVFLVERFLRNLSIEKFAEQLKTRLEHKDQLIFLNIMPQALMDPHFRSELTIELLQKHHISPYQIVLELTEKEASVNIAHLDQLVDHYRALGFRIALDDTGSGYNSLKTLIRVKPEFIKLDKDLIRHIDKHPEQQSLVEILLEFAVQSDTNIIAEGIESKLEFQFLQRLGVPFGQGYTLGKPKETLCNGQLPLSKDYYKKRLG